MTYIHRCPVSLHNPHYSHAYTHAALPAHALPPPASPIQPPLLPHVHPHTRPHNTSPHPAQAPHRTTQSIRPDPQLIMRIPHSLPSPLPSPLPSRPPTYRPNTRGGPALLGSSERVAPTSLLRTMSMPAVGPLFTVTRRGLRLLHRLTQHLRPMWVGREREREGTQNCIVD
jgi:hypothetical protein